MPVMMPYIGVIKGYRDLYRLFHVVSLLISWPRFEAHVLLSMHGRVVVPGPVAGQRGDQDEHLEAESLPREPFGARAHETRHRGAA